LGTALSAADLKLVSSGKGGNMFGFPLNAESGADIGQMMEGFGNSEIKDLVGGLLKKASGKNEDKGNN